MFDKTKLLNNVQYLIQFSLLGVMSFAIGLGALYILFDLLHLAYFIAVPLSVICNLAVHYGTTREFVFTNSNRSVQEGFVIFALIGVIEIILITGIVALVVEYAMGDVYWTRIVAGIAVALLGFWANARYNFNAI